MALKTTTRIQRTTNPYAKTTGRVRATRPQIRGRRRQQSDGILIGTSSILCFLAFFICLLLGFKILMSSAQAGDTAGLAAGGAMGILSFLFPIIGTILGVVGVVIRGSNKIISGIGCGLNGLLLGFIVINMISRHS